MHLVIIFTLIFSVLFSLELGMEAFAKEVHDDSYYVNVRLVIARDYIDKGDYGKAEVLVNYVLDLDKNHTEAKILMHDIKNFKY